MEALLEAPDGAPAVQRQGRAADPFGHLPGVAAQPKARCHDPRLAASDRCRDPDVDVADAQGAGVPALQVAGPERDLEPDHVLEEALLAVAELSAARRIP